LRLCRGEKAKYKADKQQGLNVCEPKTHYEYDKIPPETFDVKIDITIAIHYKTGDH